MLAVTALAKAFTRDSPLSLPGWEFDLLTCEYFADPTVRLRRYPLTVEGNDVFVDLSPAVSP